MTLWRYFELSCDRCGDHSEPGAVSAKEARALARAAGWRVAEVEGRRVDLCARCYAHLKKSVETP